MSRAIAVPKGRSATITHNTDGSVIIELTPTGQVPLAIAPMSADTPSIPAICVYGLNPETTERTLNDIFGQYGRIQSITSRPKNRFAAIYYFDLSDAADAAANMNGRKIDEVPVEVQLAAQPYRADRKHRSEKKNKK